MPDKVLITGYTGFVGSKLVDTLDKEGGYSLYGVNTKHGNMLSNEFNTEFEAIRPDIVVHCAGYNGNIDFNIKNKFDILQQNTEMANRLFDQCIKYKPKCVISLIASCAYNSDKSLLHETDILTGKPHETVEGHGYAKRHLQLLSNYAREQYGINSFTVCFPTLYGPGDSFNLAKTKVMGSLIKKFVDAVDNGLQEVELWGNGEPRRQFLYIDDAVCELVCCVKENLKLGSTKPYHICDSINISIKNLANKIAILTGFDGNIKWNTSMSNGQKDKTLIQQFMTKEYTSLDDGIRKTIDYYRSIK